MSTIRHKRLIGLAGWSGVGKTTLITALIPILAGRGLKVSTIKHAHHAFDVDQPGKDSWLHRQAGATEVLVASANRFALIHELRGAPEPSLEELLSRLAPADLVIVEGFRHGAHPKIEIFRPELGKPSPRRNRSTRCPCPGCRSTIRRPSPTGSWPLRRAIELGADHPGC
jgi:molybdopterin-guanine dinucleotide biosynthesis protein B